MRDHTNTPAISPLGHRLVDDMNLCDVWHEMQIDVLLS